MTAPRTPALAPEPVNAAGGGRPHRLRVRAPGAAPLTVARRPPEERGIPRDGVGLLVSSSEGHRRAVFADLPGLLRRGDVLVVNRSATLPASLPASGRLGAFTLNLSTAYGPRLWLAEARPSPALPGPVPLQAGDRFEVAGVGALALGTYPGIPRLRFVAFESDPSDLMAAAGRPIRYGYLDSEPPLEAYQTVFADVPGSAEMPSAGRPFTPRTLAGLEEAGVELAKVTLHAGVSSLEAGDYAHDELYPEPFEVTEAVAGRLNLAVSEGRRLLAVGTTVVRALASAWDGRAFRAAGGMTRVFVRPGRVIPPLAGLITGFHEPEATHLAMLEAIAGADFIAEAYEKARSGGYLWHEFGDTHLILAPQRTA